MSGQSLFSATNIYPALILCARHSVIQIIENERVFHFLKQSICLIYFSREELYHKRLNLLHKFTKLVSEDPGLKLTYTVT